MILTKNKPGIVKIDSIDIDFEEAKKIKEGRLNELLLIVPTNRKTRYRKKEIISSSPKNAAGKINLETIGTFAEKLLFSASSVRSKILSEAASAVLLKQSFQESAGQLKYFSAYKEEIPAGTLERIKNVISEYKKNGILPDDLKREAETLKGSEKNKASDISRIYEIYQQKIKALNVREIGDVYAELIEEKINFEKRFREIYPDVNLIIINGFDEFTSPEIEIINYTSEIKKVRLFLSFDYYLYNPLIFSHLDKCYNKLIAKGFEPIKDLSPALFLRFQNDVRENLFKQKSKKQIENFKTEITRITTSNREKEVELIAKEIKELITEKNYKPNEICVAFNLIHKYSPIVRDIFSAYGIPFNLTDRFSLSTSPPVVSIINFLEILENDFYYKNIFRALSGGYLKAASVNLSNLLKASVNLRIISGLNNWKENLADAINIIEDEDDEENFSFEKEIYLKAKNDIEIIENYLLPFEENMTSEEFYNNLLNLVFLLKLPAELINAESESIEKNVKALNVFLEILKEIFDLFEIEFGKEKKFPLKFFLNNIRTAVSSSRYNVKEKPGYGVQVTTLNEIRGLEFKNLFIVGLCDGDFPTRYQPEIFFSGSFVKNELYHQTAERYHFYQTLCTWKEKLYLTFPKHDDRFEFAESNFLNEFTKLFIVKNKCEKDYSKTIYSKEELLKFAGEYGVDNLKENQVSDEIEKILNLENLKHSVKVDKTRIEEPFGESEFTGNISGILSEKAKEKLNEFKDKEYSTSQLETYAKCPYKYFAERVLNLKPVEEPTEEIEALEMGSLLHNILYEFYKKLSEKKIILAKASGEEFNYAQKLIFKIAEEKIKEANYSSPLTFYEKEKILGINGDKKNSLLFKFLEYERENFDGFIPEFFEIGFGKVKDEKKLYVEKLKAGEVKVRGKIDRVDLNKKEKKFKIVDYKLSGKKPSENDLLDGISLQLPLYMFAAKELIKAQLDKDYQPAGGEIYSLKFSKDDFGKRSISVQQTRKKFLLDKDAAYEKLIEICIEAVDKYVKEINEGKFNLSTLKDRENKVCRFCSFKSVCRIQEVN